MTDFDVSDHVQHLDRGAPGVLILVLEHLDQVFHGLGVIDLDDQVDGLVLHVDLRVAQHGADERHVERPVHARQPRERRGADQLAVVLELLLHGLLDLRQIEARQDVDDVQPRDGILALDPRDQVVDGGFIGDFADDLEQRGALGGLLGIGRLQQLAHRKARLLRRNHVEDRRFRHLLLVQGVEEGRRRVIAAGG